MKNNIKPSGTKAKDRIGKFYDFSINDEKFSNVQKIARKTYFKHFRNAFIFGLLIEAMIT